MSNTTRIYVRPGATVAGVAYFEETALDVSSAYAAYLVERGAARLATKRDIYPMYLATDEAWSEEGLRLFGKRWGDVRYTPRAHGEPGTELRRLYDAYIIQREAWHAAPSATDMLYSDPDLPEGALGKHVRPPRYTP